MSLTELLFFRSSKSEAERLHDSANDDMAMLYDDAEETDLRLHSKNDRQRHKYMVTTFRSIKDGQADFRGALKRFSAVMLVVAALELMHRDNMVAQLAASVLKFLLSP